MAWSKFKTGSMKPVHLSASDLFRGTAAGAPVAGEYLFGPGLHLICLLMRHRFMMNGCVIIHGVVRNGRPSHCHFLAISSKSGIVVENRTI